MNKFMERKKGLSKKKSGRVRDGFSDRGEDKIVGTLTDQKGED